MWTYKIEFETLNTASDFVNKLNELKTVEYHISANTIYFSGENMYDKELVLQSLAENIAKSYKSTYLNDNIKLNFLPIKQKNALIKALTIFDIESDIYFILLYIEKYNKLIMSSFNIFILPKLKTKWKEFVFITNLNNDMLLNYDVFIEFLKFLLHNIQPYTKVVNLKTDLKKFLLFDDKNVPIGDRVDINDEIGLITSLVLLAPQNINIHCIDKMSNKTFKTLYYLFDKKINLLV